MIYYILSDKERRILYYKCRTNILLSRGNLFEYNINILLNPYNCIYIDGALAFESEKDYTMFLLKKYKLFGHG